MIFSRKFASVGSVDGPVHQHLDDAGGENDEGKPRRNGVKAILQRMRTGGARRGHSPRTLERFGGSTVFHVA